VADELAARTIGAKPLADGLCTVHKAAPAFDFYWRSACAPVLHAGFLPPLSDGFGQFVKASSIAEKMEKHLQEQLANGKADPYDTHPPLKERIAAVAGLPAGPDQGEDLPAVSLLEAVPVLERELMAQVAGADAAAKLKAIDWGEVGSQVYVPQWTELVRLNAKGLKGLTPEALGKKALNLRLFGNTLVDYSQEAPDDAHAENLANAVAGAALILLLLQRGGRLDIAPGDDISATLGGHLVKPFAFLWALKTGELTADDWTKQCAELGIAGMDLGTVAPAIAVSTSPKLEG
jgi:hypothetical protein